MAAAEMVKYEDNGQSGDHYMNRVDIPLVIVDLVAEVANRPKAASSHKSAIVVPLEGRPPFLAG